MKRLFMILSLVAMVNLAAIAGLTAFAGMRGWLAADRVESAWAALRGDAPTPDVEGPTTSAPATTSRPVRTVMHDETTEMIVSAALDRREREIENQWRELESARLKLLQQVEAFKAEQDRRRQEAEERARTEGDSGFAREMELLEGAKPKLAKDLLKDKPDADVVKILMTMDERKAKRIVDQCKTSDDRLWIGRILTQLHESDAEQAEALGAGTQPNPGA